MITTTRQQGTDMPEQILSKEEIEAEDRFMKGIPRFNIGAFFLPFIWGPAHGFWITILYYPVLLFADNAVYAAYSEQSVLAIVVAVLIVVSLIVVTAFFAILSQPYAAHRAVNHGSTKEAYLKRQKIWAVVAVVVFAIMMGLATYYNLMIRPGLEV